MVDVKDIGQGRIQLELPETKKQQGASGFQAHLKAYVKQVDQLQKESAQATQELVAGKTENIHQTMMAMEKADVSFKLMVETRNRMVKVYEEIMKMSV